MVQLQCFDTIMKIFTPRALSHTEVGNRLIPYSSIWFLPAWVDPYDGYLSSNEGFDRQIWMLIWSGAIIWFNITEQGCINSIILFPKIWGPRHIKNIFYVTLMSIFFTICRCLHILKLHSVGERYLDLIKMSNTKMILYSRWMIILWTQREGVW